MRQETIDDYVNYFELRKWLNNGNTHEFKGEWHQESKVEGKFTYEEFNELGL